MNKNTIFVGLLVVTVFVIGMVFFNKTKVETQKPTTKNEVTKTVDISPTNEPTTVSNDVIDAKLKEIDLDVNSVNNSFSDTAVDVMAE